MTKKREQRRRQERRRLSLGPKQLNELLATAEIQEMLKKQGAEAMEASMNAPLPEPQPEPEPEPQPRAARPGQPAKQPRARTKRRARPKKTTDSAKTDESGAPALTPTTPTVEDAETPRFRKTYDAPERDTPRSPATPKLASLVGDIESAGLVPPAEKPPLARGDSAEKGDDDTVSDPPVEHLSLCMMLTCNGICLFCSVLAYLSNCLLHFVTCSV